MYELVSFYKVYAGYLDERVAFCVIHSLLNRNSAVLQGTLSGN